jgi:hypothetical protein
MRVGQERTGVAGGSVEWLLTLPVRLHGLTLGRPVDVLLDRDELKVVGLDVLCGDGEHRFLPVAASEITAEAISISSPLVLLEEDELAFYRSRTFSFGALRGRPVRRRDRQLGLLRGLRLHADFAVAAVVVDVDGREQVVPFDDAIRFDPRNRSAA